MAQITNCRSCDSTELSVVLDLGEHPVANALLTEDQLDQSEPRFPLALAFCRVCAMLQVTETVPRALLYQRDYPYFSSVSAPVLRHAAEHVNEIIITYGLDDNSFVLELGSNDGYLLRNFVRRGIPCLGFDPAHGPVKRAREAGIPTMQAFFGRDIGDRMASGGKCADVVIANNVLAHVDDINDFIAGISCILEPLGVAIFEFAYAMDLVERCEFDTIYHEHLFYHTLRGLEPLLARHGLHQNDAKRLSIHGGSLRLTVSRLSSWKSPALNALLAYEDARGVTRIEMYKDLSERVRVALAKLSYLLWDQKLNRKTIACYGAAAKGATLLNCLGLPVGFFEFAVDATPAKQGKYTPGLRMPIVHPDELLRRQPDDVLLLAWNFAEEIIGKEKAYRERGGRWIVPIPEPRIIEPGDAALAA